MAATVVNRQRGVAVSPSRLAQAAARALAAVGRPVSDLDILVVDDAEMRRMNRRFLGVDASTDVLAFPLEVPRAGGDLLGQVVISADTARLQARQLGVAVALEMALLVTHAVLHLVGYDDRDPAEARLMHLRERQILEVGARISPRLWDGLLEGASSPVA